jgi:hypothetical protein
MCGFATVVQPDADSMLIDDVLAVGDRGTGNSLAWLPPLAVLCAIPAIGFWLFNREAPRVAEDP